MIPAVARPAVPGLYLDTNTPVTRAVAEAVRSIGYLGIFRYVNLPGLSPAKDISTAELELLLELGLGSAWVQHPRLPGWDPGQHPGEKDAQVACATAKLAGYAPGTHGFADFEGMALEAKRTDAIQWGNDFAHVLLEEGFKAGAYMGYQVPLDPVDYWDFRDVDIYWSDASKRRVYKRGVSVNQGSGITIAGVEFDVDTIKADNLDGLPMMTIAQTTAQTT